MTISAHIGSVKPGAPSKTSSQPTMQFSETEPTVAVETSLELDQALHKAELRCASQRPIVVSVYVHGHLVRIGLGLPHSFINIQRCEPAPGPGLMSIGDARINGGAVFFFHGWHHTDIPRRNLLPATRARQILREFFETGMRPSNLDWEAL